MNVGSDDAPKENGKKDDCCSCCCGDGTHGSASGSGADVNENGNQLGSGSFFFAGLPIISLIGEQGNSRRWFGRGGDCGAAAAGESDAKLNGHMWIYERFEGMPRWCHGRPVPQLNTTHDERGLTVACLLWLHPSSWLSAWLVRVAGWYRGCCCSCGGWLLVVVVLLLRLRIILALVACFFASSSCPIIECVCENRLWRNDALKKKRR